MRAVDGGGVDELCCAVLQGVERVGDLRVDAIGVGDEVAGGEGLGGEGWIVGSRGESEMKSLRCAGLAARRHRERGQRGCGAAG